MNRYAELNISTATINDAREIAEVHVLSWQQAYGEFLPADILASLSIEKREAMWRDVITTGSAELLVAKSEEKVVGFVAFGPSRDEGVPSNTAQIFAIYLAPHVWANGVGRELWLASLQRIVARGFNSIILWVIAKNARAIRFYEAAGFASEPSSLTQVTVRGTTVEALRYVRKFHLC